jgi:hypothetical protein
MCALELCDSRPRYWCHACYFSTAGGSAREINVAAVFSSPQRSRLCHGWRPSLGAEMWIRALCVQADYALRGGGWLSNGASPVVRDEPGVPELAHRER